MLNCILSGVGGQGTVLLSRLIGAAALRSGQQVRGTETIGMAQRGGSVVSHVRMSDSPIDSPLIPPQSADLMIAFEPGEGVRAFPLLKPGASAIVLDRAVQPVTSSLREDGYAAADMLRFLETHIERLMVVQGDALIRTCGSAKVVNVALLGAAIGNNMLPVSLQDAQSVLRERLPERFWELNLHALSAGYALAAEGAK